MCGCMNKKEIQPSFKLEGRECLYLKEQLEQLRDKAVKMDVKYPEMMASHILNTQIEEYDVDCSSFAIWIKDNIENFTNEL
mgnify:CR=1 FL=1